MSGTQYLPEFYVDAASEHRWRIWSANARIIAASSEGYKNKSDARENLLQIAGALSKWIEMGAPG